LDEDLGADLDVDFPLEVVSSTWQVREVAVSCSNLAIHPNKIRNTQDLERYKDNNLTARVKTHASYSNQL
jgi:hypothetical protein